MKRQKKSYYKIFATAITAMMILTGCGQKNSATDFEMDTGMSDLEYVQSKGTLVVGVTDYAPMDYLDGEEWTGFDADLAEAFAESIGVTVELVEINWDKKTELLENRSIDCIWNGMTMTEELQQTIACSNPYLSNAQVIVLRGEQMEKYVDLESCQHLLFAVEAGSTGESLLRELKYRYTTFSTQKEALQSVRAKKADAAVIDIIMASYYTDDGQEFEDLGFHVSLNDEKICIGFRRNSDLKEQANVFLENRYEDNTISSLAEQYGIESAVLQVVK